MDRIGSSFTLALCLTFLFGCTTATVRAQQGVDVEALFDRLTAQGGSSGDQAAYDLFKLKNDKVDRRLVRIMAGSGKLFPRKSILRALKWAGHTRPGFACTVAQAALSDNDPTVVALAVRRLATVYTPKTYTSIETAFNKPAVTGPKARKGVPLRWAQAKTLGGKQARGLVKVLERLGNPLRSVDVLIGVQGHPNGLSRTLAKQIKETLERMTAMRLQGRSEWKRWWTKEKRRGLSLTDWYAEVNERKGKWQKTLERQAEQYFRKVVSTLEAQPKLLIDELGRALRDPVPSVCKRAIYELGRLGGDPKSTVRKQAIGLLRARLKGDTSPDYDEIKAEVIEALGRTGDRKLLEDLVAFLDHSSPRMRAAAATAIASLRAEEAIPRLLEQVNAQQDPHLVVAAVRALGVIGANKVIKPPRFRVSDALVLFCDGLLKANGKSVPSTGLLLASVARALGKLNYGDAKELLPVLKLLKQLAGYTLESDVRFNTVTALGPLRHPDAFKVLEGRLSAEKDIRIRKEILDAMGLQAVATPDLAPKAVAALVPFLFTSVQAETALRRMSQQRLAEIAREKSLAGLSSILAELKRDRAESAALQVALPFLRTLPSAENATKTLAAMKGTEQETWRKRYYGLLEDRAKAQLTAAPKQALEDFRAVRTGRGLHTTDALTLEVLPVFMGEARALLLIPDKKPKDAFGIAEACLSKLEKTKKKPDAARLLELWTLALDALELVQKQSPSDASPLFKRLEKCLKGAPEKARKRHAALLRGPRGS